MGLWPKSRRYVALFAIVLACLAAPAARAEPLTLGTVGQASANLWPELIALDKGFYVAEDLQVDLPTGAVLRGIFEGQSNKEIAAGMETSESAVKSTIQRLFTKLGARTRSQLVRIAIERLGNQFPLVQAAKAAASDQKILQK